MSHTSTNVTATPAITSDLPESERFRILADEQRRLALDVLDERSGPVDLDAVAAEVATRSRGPDDVVDEEDVHRTAIELHHVHLPLLADLNVLDYDPASRQLVV
jgi:hypothetical protein